ncbi:MAG: agmatine deiminase family protein [Bacteroidales bacterium]|nr:agmatine deiminase family protein [Bacteroidales bacterium]
MQKVYTISKKLYFKTLIHFLLILFSFNLANAQNLPVGFGPGEQEMMPAYLQSREATGFTTPPNFPVRTAAEWEEEQALLITWTSYTSVLKEIVRNAVSQCIVLITCSDSNSVKSYLTSNNVPLTNVRFIKKDFDSVWIRDYAGNSVYRNDVDSLILVDWIYNRPRPDDDAMAQYHAQYFNIPFYQTLNSPYDLVNTGGNFMSDGFGNAFAENLILDDNPGKTTAQIDSIIKWFMGIKRYSKLTNLPYDGIHHIDMHMKMLNEETLLVGQFPSGISDGPQIEANLLYILNNFNSMFGTPYKIIRIPMCPSTSGGYPGSAYGNAYYRTYTNSVFVNKTLLVPTYYEEFDTTALRIYREALPGYNVIGINCNSTISASGAIHCITHSIGVYDPLLISHQNLANTTSSSPYPVNARIQHRSGIQSAKVYYRTDTLQPYQFVTMTLTNASLNTWTGYIPGQTGQKDVYYYIEANSNSGKIQKRPMPAPAGYFKFNVNVLTGQESLRQEFIFNNIFPNPASAITCVPITFETTTHGRLEIFNSLGQQVQMIHEGVFEKGNRNFFFDASEFSSGVYNVVLTTEKGTDVQKVIVR